LENNRSSNSKYSAFEPIFYF